MGENENTIYSSEQHHWAHPTLNQENLCSIFPGLKKVTFLAQEECKDLITYA